MRESRAREEILHIDAKQGEDERVDARRKGLQAHELCEGVHARRRYGAGGDEQHDTGKKYEA